MIHELIDKLCEANEGELRAEADKLRRRLSIIDAILGKTSKPGPKPASEAVRVVPNGKPNGSDVPLPQRIATFLKFAGPKRSDAIAREMGTNGLEAVHAMEKSDLFERDGPCWTLSSKGHTATSRND